MHPTSSLLGSSPLIQVVFNCCNNSQKPGWMGKFDCSTFYRLFIFSHCVSLCLFVLPLLCKATINGGELKPGSALCSLRKCLANTPTWLDYGNGWQFGVWRDVSLNDNWQLWRCFFSAWRVHLDKFCNQKRSDEGHSHWSDPWHQRSYVCIPDLCLVSAACKCYADVIWVTRNLFTLHTGKSSHTHLLLPCHFFPPPPRTSGLCGIKVHFTRVSGGWNWEWCHYTPHFISFNQVLQGFVMYRICRFLEHALHHPEMPTLLHVTCAPCLNYTNFLFFLSESRPRKVTYSTYINGNMAR